MRQERRAADLCLKMGRGCLGPSPASGAHSIGGLIALLERLGHPEAAATLLGAVEGMFQTNPFVKDYQEAILRSREALGAAAFEEMRRSGAGLSLHEAIDYARLQIRLALGEVDQTDA